MLNDNKKNGFTLIELSMALVIIGMIVGTISVGASLITQYRMRGAIKDISTYMALISNFESKYNGLPGDYANNGAVISGITAGNGNGIVESSETAQVWDHLLRGGFFGNRNSVPYSASTTTNEPLSILGYGTLYRFTAHQSIQYDIPDLTFNGLGITSLAGSGGVMTPLTAYTIDLKTDDGVPSTGKVYTVSYSAAACVFQSDGVTNAANNYAGTTSYNIGTTGFNCDWLMTYYDKR